MSWSISASGSREQTLEQIQRAEDNQTKFVATGGRAILQSAAAYLRAIVAAAPEGATFSLSIGGHVDDDGVSSNWLTTGVTRKSTA